MYDSIVRALRDHALAHPDKLALVAAGESLRYGELWTLARGFANYLLSTGLGRGRCVLMQTEQSLAFCVCHIGTHLAGGIFTPLERSMSPDGMKEIAQETDAHLLIAKAAVDWPNLLDAALALGEALAHQGDQRELPLPGPKEPAELLFTTGTTGKSKGVLCSHESVVGVAENLTQGMHYKEDTLIAVPGQLNHANAIRKLTAAYLFGSAVLLLDGVGNMSAFYQALDTWPVTALCLPPAAIRMLLVLSGDKLGGYRDQIDFVESGSATLPEADKLKMCELLPGSRLYNSYGTSEAGSSCMFDYNATRGLQGCIGLPAVNARFAILDERGNEMEHSSADNPGLIAYSGKMLMMGYWKAPELTAEAIQDGRVVTSDLGYIDGRGMVYVLGRQGDVINVGGNKVAPDEVEQAALRIGGIAECGCAKMPDPLSGEAVRLFVVMKDGCAFDMAAIRSALKAALPDFKVPKRIEQRGSLPRASNGKLQRKLLQ